MKKTDSDHRLFQFFYKKKKAMSTGFLVTMVIAIVAFMFIAGTIFRFMSKAEDKQAEVLCRDSVALKAAAAINFGGVAEAKLSPVLCRTLDKKISGNREEVKKEVADKMARCWWMFNEGRYQTDVFDNLNILGGGNNCFTCYTMLVEESRQFSQDHAGIMAGEFGDFISETKYKGYNGTYLDYFQFSGGPGAIRGILTSEFGIKPGRAYAIAYKAKASTCDFCASLGVGGGLAAGTILIATYAIGAPVTVPLTIAVLVGGTAAVAGKQAVAQQLFLETDLDTVILTDISNEKLFEQFANTCTLVEDIAGN